MGWERGMRVIRVLIVDDSPFFLYLLGELLGADPEIEVSGTALHGRELLTKVQELSPDVVTLDVEMPNMNGLQALTELRKTHPRLPVIMVSARTEPAAATTVDALLRGATDYVAKPENQDFEALIAELRDKIKLSVALAAHHQPADLQSLASPEAPPHQRHAELVVLGSSMGGPRALTEIFRSLPHQPSAPMVIVQHMLPSFIAVLARRLATLTEVPVTEARDGEPLLAAHAYVAPGDHHLLVVREGGALRARLTRDKPVHGCRPSADLLLESAATACSRQALAVILTGSSRDGLEGAEAIHRAGGRVWVDHEAAAVGGSISFQLAARGIASRVVPIGRMGYELSLELA